MKDGLSVIVVGQALENAHFDTPYDPDNPSSPGCFSIAPVGTPLEEMVPHPNSTRPQGPNCAKCPKAERGSAMRDGKPTKGRACGFRRRLASISVSALQDEMSVQKAEVAMCGLPVTSVRNWSGYVNKSANLTQRPPWALVTLIDTVPDDKSQFKVTFTCEGKVDNSLLPAIKVKLAEGHEACMIPYEPAPALEEESDSSDF